MDGELGAEYAWTAILRDGSQRSGLGPLAPDLWTEPAQIKCLFLEGEGRRFGVDVDSGSLYAEGNWWPVADGHPHRPILFVERSADLGTSRSRAMRIEAYGIGWQSTLGNGASARNRKCYLRIQPGGAWTVCFD